jgi:hypothetical protein
MGSQCSYCLKVAMHGNEQTCIEEAVVKDHIQNCFCLSKITQFVNAEHALSSHSDACERSKANKNNTISIKTTKEEYFMKLMTSLKKREPNRAWRYIFDDHARCVGITSGDGRCEYS